MSFRLCEAVIGVFCFCLVCFSFPFLVFVTCLLFVSVPCFCCLSAFRFHLFLLLVCFSFPFLVFAGRGVVAGLVLLRNDFRVCFVVVVVLAVAVVVVFVYLVPLFCLLPLCAHAYMS